MLFEKSLKKAEPGNNVPGLDFTNYDMKLQTLLGG